MNHKKSLVIVLCAIVLLNIIAIVVLQGKVTERTEERTAALTPPPIVQEPTVIVQEPKPLVRTLVLEDESCPDCFDIRIYSDELADVLNMSIESGDSEQFDLPILPAIAFSDDVESYPDHFTEGWSSFGTTVTIADGEYEGKWYVLPTLNPPYVETETGTVHGRVTVTYITMDSCEECYPVEMNTVFMEESRIIPYEEIFVDVTSPEGKELVAQYDITAVPTIIMSKDVDAYSNVQPGWPVVGTIEDDGSYVLRNLQRLKVTYYDLETEQVMRP